MLLAVVVGALAPEAACEDRVWVRPSLSVSEEYDTNVDLDQRNRSDFLTAFRPGIELQLTDYPWDVRLTGYMRGELYARRPELNNVENFGVSGAVGLRPERPLSLSLTGNFTRSVYAAEVDPVAGVNRGRDVSYGYTVSPALQWAIDPRTSLGASYSGSFYWSDASGTNDSDTHAFGLSGSHQLTQRLSGTASYTFSRFVIDHDPNSDSHAPRVGLSYAISPVSGVSGSIGPNVLVEEGGGTRVTLGGSFSYNQRFKDGGFSVAYNAANTASGTVGEAATTHSLTASLGVQFIRLLSFSVDGGGHLQRRGPRQPGRLPDVPGRGPGVLPAPPVAVAGRLLPLRAPGRPLLVDGAGLRSGGVLARPDGLRPLPGILSGRPEEAKARRRRIVTRRVLAPGRLVPYPRCEPDQDNLCKRLRM